MVYALDGTEPSAIQQESCLTSANVGDTVVLHCLYKSDMAMHFSWYKQPFGEKPHLISTIYKYDKGATFYHEFKDNPRFSVQSSKGINHLSISDLKSSDSATYYCGSAHSNVVEFGKGTILNVKEFNSKTVLQQSVSESVQQGDSVTLNCTIHTETCAGGHSVYWFRHGSGESHPGIIYTHGDRHDQCEKSSEAGSPTQSCVYNLPKKNLNLSDAGTYYCAVASCGEILFGDGTKLYIHDLTPVVSVSPPSSVVVHPGDNVTLQCTNVTGSPGHVGWFKQVNDSEPLCIASMYSSELPVQHHNGFQPSHMEMFVSHIIIFLKITELDVADSGLYFCGMFDKYVIFTNATLLKVQGMYPIPLVLILGVVTAALPIVILILVLKIRRDTNRHNTDDDEDDQTADNSSSYDGEKDKE
ncbi:uncharacterized protein LOC123492739 [Coregonus clupeaformis]|uniref:uncharacterized protein LOC123492739 n=1 Tax=Coregonus clupeaformis TaxID=59861 RepID=UPI001E1C868D|nr:uncharacterized protein LOC123492739 [Coregonus clupeaformis]